MASSARARLAWLVTTFDGRWTPTPIRPGHATTSPPSCMLRGESAKPAISWPLPAKTHNTPIAPSFLPTWANASANLETGTRAGGLEARQGHQSAHARSYLLLAQLDYAQGDQARAWDNIQAHMRLTGITGEPDAGARHRAGQGRHRAGRVLCPPARVKRFTGWVPWHALTTDF